MKPGAVIACEEYYDEDCPSSRCTYYGDPLYRCVAKDKSIPCVDLDEYACKPLKTCKWTDDENNDGQSGEGFCGDCPAGADCTETTNNDDVDPEPMPDDGKPCADHNNQPGPGTDDYNPCPEPRCYLAFPVISDGSLGMCGGYGGGTCRDAVCTDHSYDERSCTKQTGCTYDADANVCYDSAGGVFPCSAIFDETECPTDKCDWKQPVGTPPQGDGFCIKKGAGIPCNAFSGEMSGSACEGNDDGDGNKCVWVEQLESCFTKQAADDMACSIYNEDPDACPAPKCELQQGVCWETGKELPCSAICEASTCELTGHCTYKASDGGDRMGVCSECEDSGCPAQKPCSSYV